MKLPDTVVPHAGTWIEISVGADNLEIAPVVPHAGTWIEISLSLISDKLIPRSFPTRERGLKLVPSAFSHAAVSVVPHAGTWIEIIAGEEVPVPAPEVVPHAGTWIEIVVGNSNLKETVVVPHAGTWIEIHLF